MRLSPTHAGLLVALASAATLRADVFDNVPEAVAQGYVVVYELEIPVNAGFCDTTPVPYTVDEGGTPLAFDRVAYYLELDDGGEWIYVSMDAFTSSLPELGVPHNVDNPVVHQRGVSQMNIASNKPGVTTGTGFGGGNLEIWPSNYTPANEAGIAGASDATHDFGDGGESTAAGYGSFQVHNQTAGGVLLAWNRWGVADAAADDIGIGTNPSNDPDWTFEGNAGSSSSRRLCVLVRPEAAPHAVTFTDLPDDFQLLPRDRSANAAELTVAGRESGGGFTSAVLRIYRDDIQVGAEQVHPLDYTSGEAPFSFTASIPAELAQYDVEVLLRTWPQPDVSVRRVEDLVAGDVFLIQGQSNADAQVWSGQTANGYVTPYVRTYGLNSSTALGTLNADSWAVAQGDGSHEVPAGIGQWGLVMANELVTENGVPVAVLNGGDPGRPMSFFQRNDTNPLALATNYGRLLHRAQAAGLDVAVRAILFYQGESEQGDGPAFESGYVNLRADWLVDFPATERFYVFQVREGCGVARFDLDLRNRQRLLADEFPDVSVMSVNGPDFHDGCHFGFTGGYELIGMHMARMVQRDIYGGPALASTNPPNPASAGLTGPNDDIIRIPLRDPADAVTFDPGAEDDFTVIGSPVSVESGSIVNGAIELQLSGNASSATAVGYTGHTGPGAGVANANGIGLLAFVEPLSLLQFGVEFEAPDRSMEAVVGAPLEIRTRATSDGANAITEMDLCVGPGRVASTAGMETLATGWTPPAPGAYTLTARATDAAGQVALKRITVFAGVPAAPGGIAGGLRVWLRAGTGLTLDGSGLVSQWADQSGHGHSPAQTAPGARPRFVEEAFGCLPGVRFEGDDFLDSPAGMPTGSYTKVVRYKLLDVTANNNIVASGVPGAGTHSLGHDATPTPKLYHGGNFVVSGEALTNGREVIVSATYDATDNRGEIFIDGAGTGTGTATSDNLTPTFQLGAYNSGAFLEGVIGEVIIYDRVLEPAERVAVESYLGDRCLRPFEIWQGAVPGALLPDADLDGFSPVVEYAFGTDPLGPDFSLPVRIAASGSSAVFERPAGFDHVHYELRVGTDLIQWSPLEKAVGAITPAPGRPGFETVTVPLPPPWAGASPLFLNIAPLVE